MRTILVAKAYGNEKARLCRNLDMGLQNAAANVCHSVDIGQEELVDGRGLQSCLYQICSEIAH